MAAVLTIRDVGAVSRAESYRCSAHARRCSYIRMDEEGISSAHWSISGSTRPLTFSAMEKSCSNDDLDIADASPPKLQTDSSRATTQLSS